MALLHFSHRHRLSLRNTQGLLRRSPDCKACTLPISESHYGCDYCEFNIHSACAKLPREMENHPFHPQHTLTLLAQPPYNKSITFKCNVCGFRSKGFTFHCSECNFDMDLTCAAMMPVEEGCTSTRPQILKNSKHPHPHPLLVCANKNINFSPKCFCCRLPIITKEASVLVCLECRALMHGSCAEFPQEIQHILHPQHPLILTVNKYDREVVCGACGKCYGRGFFYRCVQSDFDLDVACALLTPTTNEEVDEHHHVSSHPHPLIECYRKKKSLPLFCSGCMKLFEEEEYVYVCLRCPKLLHKSCAHSPRQIDHPFHSAHPLSLYDETPYGQIVKHKCQACMKGSYRNTSHFYRCCKCDFYLHTKCALPVSPFLNSQAVFHPHRLAFLDIKEDLPCNSCKLICHYPFFRCVECDFNFHVHCLSVLPLTVKHKCHLHPLTITHSPIKDHDNEDDDAEFYCDACEEYRLLNEPTYYCVECHYVAHVHCVISEVFPYLEREFASLGDKLDKMKLDIPLDVVEDIAGLELQRDAQEEKVEILEGAFISAGTEDDLVIARGDDSSTEAIKELVDTTCEALLAELDAEIVELKIKLDQLQKRRAQYLSSQQK